MSDYNKVIILGRLTRDIELKQAGSSQVANIGVAMSHKYRGRDDQWKEQTVYVDCEAWGRPAEVMAQYLSKGRPVFIEGRLKLDQWQDQRGNNRSKLKVMVESFQFVGGKDDGQQRQSQDRRDGELPPSTPAQSHKTLDSSEIPF